MTVDYRANNATNNHPRKFACWITLIQRISICVAIGVITTKPTNRVTGHIPPRCRVIEPAVVVMQPSLHILHLPRQAQVAGDGGFVCGGLRGDDASLRADSIVVNPHKWLFTPFDLSVLYCKDLNVLKEAFSLVAEYLKTSDEQTVKNGMDYGIQLGRRFRALKFWFVIRYFGREGLIARLREHCRLARLFASWVEESPDFELLAPVPFALVCFRACPAGIEDLNALNEKIMSSINTSGEAYLSHTKLDGKYTLRLSVGSIRVEERHLQKVWNLLNEHVSVARTQGLS